MPNLHPPSRNPGPERRPAIERTALIGVDSPIGLTVLRELGRRAVPVLGVGRSPRALGRYSRYASGFAVRPSGPIACWLPGFAAAHRIAAVMAISEADLVELAALRHAVPGVTIAVPGREPLDRVLDKRQTLAAAERLGIATPATWLPRADEDRVARAAGLAYPVAVKWADPTAIAPALERAGLALEKVAYATGPAELLAILSRTDALGAWPLVQEFCPGSGLGQMLYMAGGRAVLRFQHRRLREWPVTGGVSSLCEAVPLDRHATLMARSEALLAALGWEGAAMVEYRHDPATERSVLMEVNGRFWGSLPLAHHCGAHFAWETYRRQVLGEADDLSHRPVVRRARYLAPDAKHLAAVLRDPAVALSAKTRLAASFVLAFVDPRTGSYVWSAGDPAPFLADLAATAVKLVRREKRGPAAAPPIRSARSTA